MKLEEPSDSARDRDAPDLVVSQIVIEAEQSTQRVPRFHVVTGIHLEPTEPPQHDALGRHRPTGRRRRRSDDRHLEPRGAVAPQRALATVPSASASSTPSPATAEAAAQLGATRVWHEALRRGLEQRANPRSPTDAVSSLDRSLDHTALTGQQSNSWSHSMWFEHHPVCRRGTCTFTPPIPAEGFFLAA